MKIIIKNKTDKIIFDLKKCQYPYQIRSSIKKALALDGFIEGDINEIFNQMPDVKCVEDENKS